MISALISFSCDTTWIFPGVLGTNVLCVSWNWLKLEMWFCDVISRFLDFCPEYWKRNILWYTRTLISYVWHRTVCSRERDSFLMQDFVPRGSQSNFHDKSCGNCAVLWCNFPDPLFSSQILSNIYFLVYEYMDFVYISGWFGMIWTQVRFACDKTWIFQCVLGWFGRRLDFHVIQLEYFRPFWGLMSYVFRGLGWRRKCGFVM